MDDYPELIEHGSPELRDPVMVIAFRGWNDAGEAATFATVHLARTWAAERFAFIDAEDFYDFQAVRPHVELVDGLTRRISWPANEFAAAHLPGREHDLITLVGTEPNLRWRRFSRIVTAVAKRYQARLVITLGALLADVAHTRPTPITGTADSEELVSELGMQRSRYEGPTGIVGVLHESMAAAGIRSASLWAAVPHYLAVSPNPKAALALVTRTGALLNADADVADLQRAARTYEERVSEMVAQDEDVAAYVRTLEERADQSHPMDPSSIPSGDALAAELERFLRERNDGDGTSPGRG